MFLYRGENLCHRQCAKMEETRQVVEVPSGQGLDCLEKKRAKCGGGKGFKRKRGGAGIRREGSQESEGDDNSGGDPSGCGQAITTIAVTACLIPKKRCEDKEKKGERGGKEFRKGPEQAAEACAGNGKVCC